MTDIDTDRTQQWDLDANAWVESFSNFTPDRLTIPGGFLPAELEPGEVVAATPEALFQAYKTLAPVERLEILVASSPGRAKRLGRKCTLRPDWEKGFAIEAMREVVQSRCDQHPYFVEDLRSTGDRPIIEVTSWNDTRWGTTRTGKGANALGQLLMERRAAL